MPVQVVPPMYKMLSNEVKWAIDDVSVAVFMLFLP
jgi:protein BCP1